jgi:hypothetical protein
MSSQKSIEKYLELIYVLEETFRKVQHLDPLPLSFYSTSIDILNRLKVGIHELESIQLQTMMKLFKNDKKNLDDIDLILDVNPKIQPDDELFDLTIVNQPEENFDIEVIENLKNQLEEKVPIGHSSFLGDTIVKKIYPDFRKSLTLNHRFMFQRDVFHGNVEKMEKALARINTFQTLSEAVYYLDENYFVQWESDAGIALRDLLEKRFS